MSKEMIKTLMILGGITLVLIVITVSGRGENNYRNALLMDKTVDSLLEAIQVKDSDSIKHFFSEGVREEVGEEKFDKGIEYLYSLFDGDIVFKEMVYDYGKGRANDGFGRKRVVVRYLYSVKTTVDTYKINIIYYTVDTITPDFKGMYSLWIQKESESYGIGYDFMGIYVPPEMN